MEKEAVKREVREPAWCDRCHGRGRIFVEWDWSSGFEEEITERCNECGGTGNLDDDDDDYSLT